MLKRILSPILVLLVLCGYAHAQVPTGFTQVTATVVDSGTGVPYRNAHGNAAFVPAPNATKQPTISGSTFQTDVPISQLDSFGTFSLVLADNNLVSDGHQTGPASQWRFNITSPGALCNFTVVLTVTGPAVNLSAALTAATPPGCLSGGGGGGGLQSVALTEPIEFSVAGSPVVPPSGTFVVSKVSEAQNSVWAGPCSGGPGIPVFRLLCAGDIPPFVSITATAPIVVTPSPITGTGVVSCPTCTTASSPVKRIILPYASCVNASPQSAWDLPTASAAVAACKTGGVNGTVQGTLQFNDGQIAYYSGVVPSDWQSWNIARISFTTSDTTNGHTIIFNLALACETPNAGNTDDPAYGAANATSTVIGGGAVANASYQASTSSLTGGGCAAGSVLHMKLTRATDTATDTAVTATGWLEVLYNGGFN